MTEEYRLYVYETIKDVHALIEAKLGTVLDAEQIIGIIETPDERYVNHVKRQVVKCNSVDEMAKTILIQLY